MVKAKRKKAVPERTKAVKETDSTYFLKLVMYLIVGSQWVRLENMPDWSIPIPVGLLIGVWFTSRERFQIDRKIEYAILLVSMFVGFWLPLGLVFQV